MKPTTTLRWLQFHASQNRGQHPTARWYSEAHGLLHVLQQWWESDVVGESGEWRDIPIEVESV